MDIDSFVLEQILDISNEGYKVIDKNFNIIYCNEKYAQFNHLEIKEIIEKKCHHCLGSNNCGLEKCSLIQILNGKESIQEILENKSVAGDTKYYILNVSPFKNKKNETLGIIECFIDITAIKKTELALRKSEAQLKKINATKDKLFSIIAHDLRTPFTSIIGFSELLTENTNDLGTTKIEEFAKDINSSARNTLFLLDNLLNWAKTQTGIFIMQPGVINLSTIIRETIEILKAAASLKNLSINYNQQNEIDILADENMVKIVLRNLVSNAIKFTQTGGRINIFTTLHQNKVEVSVSDNGVGMNAETYKKLFDISANSSSYGTEKEKGSGLGLILCKEFVEKLGGKIWAESKEGKGSDFKFTLPLNHLNK